MPRGPPMPTRRPKIDPSGSMIALTCSPMTLRPTALKRSRSEASSCEENCRQARNLLDATERPVKAIAFDCGFANPQQMRAAFQRRLGVSPLRYRESFQPYPPRVRSHAESGLIDAPGGLTEIGRASFRERVGQYV